MVHPSGPAAKNLVDFFQLNDQEQFTATASAILQIWSGNCRLACRQGVRPQNSEQTQESPYLSDSSTNQNADLYRTNQAASNCVCDSCPCGLVDELLRTYVPVRMELADALSSYYYFGLEWFTSLDRVGSEENFSFGTASAKKGLSVSNKKSPMSISTDEGTSRGQRSMSIIKFTSDDDKSDTNNCSRCLSQGKTCMKSCPKAKK
ncbi:hypothetical protein MSG28_008325 [Choristoneura fumiferana]|uniref:Uncharacterized protein n=1 Tax=Choristoneura fumiferana TaxID=7141 RepID=A0ACC0JB85_CHOFU|nr:hypothetical protein MSG28_008325 [Choristoneura fumiferana]